MFSDKVGCLLFPSVASLALLPALALAASSTNDYSTSTSITCSASGAAYFHRTSTRYASAETSSTSITYTTFTTTPVTKTVTETVTSHSGVVPTSDSFYPILDTVSTLPAPAAQANHTVTFASTSTVTCTDYETIHTTVLLFPANVTTVTAPPITPTVTAMNTTTVVAPSYAACAADNVVSNDPLTGDLIVDIEFDYEIVGGNTIDQFPATTAYDCCVSCIQEPSCAFSYFNPNGSQYHVKTDTYTYAPECFYQTASTCDQSANHAEWISGTPYGCKSALPIVIPCLSY